MGHIFATIGFELAGLIALAIIALTLVENWALVWTALRMEHRANIVTVASAARRVRPTRYRAPAAVRLQPQRAAA